MKMRIKTLAVLTAIASSAMIAGAQEQMPKQQNGPKPTEFKCPVCGSPCVSKADIIKQSHKRMKARATKAGQSDGAAMGNPRSAQGDQPFIREKLQKRAMRFDLDGDGQLSKAERAALRAYRTELRKERAGPPENRKGSQPPVE